MSVKEKRCPFATCAVIENYDPTINCECGRDWLGAVWARSLDEAVAACNGALIEGDDGPWNVAVNVCAEYVDNLRQVTP